MRNWIALFGCALLCGFSVAGRGQAPNFNLTQIGILPYTEELNDIWGYVDETGIEYALVGTVNGFSVVDLSDNTNPVEVFYTGGLPTTWRDVKVWDDRAYITNEGGDGLTIVDLRPLPQSAILPVHYYTGVDFPFQTAHNIYIDNGIAYLWGADGGNDGALYLDLTNPDSPTEIGSYNTFYGHDGYVRDNTMYICHINDGFFGVYDISTLPTTNLLQSRATINLTSHQLWPSDDSKYIFTADEVAGGYIGAYDISDLSNIEEVDRYQSRPGSGSPPHNVFYLNGFLVISHYSDGVIILDVHRPSNMVEMGRYDTSPTYSAGEFEGCWGVYPYLPSGIILATDIQEGLVLLQANYQEATYLEGTVRDLHTNLPINGVKVAITTTGDSLFTNIKGEYATGFQQPGSYVLTFSKTGYPSVIDTVVLSAGVSNLTVHDVYLDNWPVAIAESALPTNWTLFPNPSTASFQLVADRTLEAGFVSIRNLQGQEVSNEALEAGKSYGEALADGWYWVEVIEASGATTRKQWVKVH